MMRVSINLSPRPGDIVLFQGDTIVDDIIRLGTRSTWNHVATIMPSGEMVQALPQGVIVAPVASRGPYWLVQTGTTWSSAASALVKATVGEPYSYLNDLLAGLGLPPATTKAWECAQLAAALLRAMGWKLASDCDTPQKIAMACAERGALFQWQDPAEKAA